MPTDPFAALVDTLDLASSASQLGRNDLLPPRLEDGVGGELGNRLTAWLAHEMRGGRYRPERAVIIPVPKPGLATRPAALLTLRDRVVYQALVARLRETVDAAMQPASAVLWPRGTPSPPRWAEFNRAPAEVPECSHVVLLDVATFYESIDHGLLTSRLLQIGARPPVANTLEVFLGHVMGSARGLPQGVSASDPLATTYLGSVDSAIVGEGYHYFRHGDDIRLSVANYGEGVRAVAVVEAKLRAIGLNLNGSKARILTIATYRKELTHLEATKTALRRRLEDVRVTQLLGGDPEFLGTLLQEQGYTAQDLEGVDPEDVLLLLAPDNGPYESWDFDTTIELLRANLTPRDEELASSLFTETLERGPLGDRTLPADEAHERLRDALTTLGAAGNPHAIAECGRLLAHLPAETELVVGYLSHLPEEHTREWAAQIGSVLADPGFRHAWQDAWLLSSFIERPADSPSAAFDAARKWIAQEGEDWIRRVGAARLLAAIGALEHSTLTRLWAAAPKAFQPELVAAAATMSAAGATWARAFIESVQDDRVCAVVLHHLGLPSAP